MQKAEHYQSMKDLGFYHSQFNSFFMTCPKVGNHDSVEEITLRRGNKIRREDNTLLDALG